MENLRDLLKEFYPFAKERFGFDKNAKIIFLEDEDNASNPLGKTAYYNPSDYTVSVYVTGRHPKDILRSVSHELVHHTQNCRGEFTNKENVGGEGYAQKDEHLREMEREAYEQGNMCFRDWEDMRKNNLDTNYVNEDGDMSNKDLRNHRLNSHIMNKWGFSSKKEETEEQVEEQIGSIGDLTLDFDDEYEDPEIAALKNDPEFAELFKDLERDADEEGAYADAAVAAGNEYDDEEELDELPFQEGAKVYVIATENCGEEATVLEMLDDATAKIQIGDEELVIRQDYLEKIKLDEAAKPDFLDLDDDGDELEPMKAAAEDAEEDEDEDVKGDIKENAQIEFPQMPGEAAYGPGGWDEAFSWWKNKVVTTINDAETGAFVKLKNGATATKQGDDVWKISGEFGSLKDGEVVKSISVIKNVNADNLALPAMNEEMEIEDPEIKMTPEVLDMITEKGATIELAGGAKATKQDDNEWKISGAAVDAQNGQTVSSSVILRNLDLPKSGIEEELTDQASSLNLKQHIAQALEKIADGEPNEAAMILHDVLENLESDDPKFNPMAEEETVEEISYCAGGAVEGAAMASKNKKDEDEEEKLEESFSIKSAASNRNKLLSEQVMKAWFNK